LRKYRYLDLFVGDRPGPDGVMRPADRTFPSKTDAESWLTRNEAEVLDGEWINPDAGKVLLTSYGAAWIGERPSRRARRRSRRKLP
jgi:hypothetical protein